MPMSLDALRTLIETSSPDAWARMDHPLMLPMFHPTSSHDHGLELDVGSHHTLLTHVDDVEVQLAFGMDLNHTPTGQADYQKSTFDWAAGFLHPEGTPVRVHTLYRGAVVDHAVAVSFDGAWLPLPEYVEGDGGVEQVFGGRSLRIARLLHAIDYPADPQEAEHLMNQSGLRILE